MRQHLNNLLLVALALLLTASSTTRANDEPKSVDSARKSLSKMRLPWYDEKTDDVRSVGATDETDQAKNRESEWERNARKKKGRDNRNLPTGGGNPGGGGSFWSAMQVLFWILLAIGVAAAVVLLVWAFIKNESKEAEETQSSVLRSNVDDIARVENLPFEVRAPKGDLLSEARRHYGAGNYGEAIIYYYSHLLVQLDKFHVIHLTKGKTNRQYVRETGQRPPIRSILERTMLAFEDVFFGHHKLDRDRFEGCWSNLDAFQREVEQVAR